LSIWSATLAEFRDNAESVNPVPAGVAISAVTATLALALLVKVLEITRRRENFAGDPQKIDAMIEGARRESALLNRLADDDIHAFNRYLECVRKKETPDEAMREAITVPMDAARATVRGLVLCREATALYSAGLTAADLGAAASLLSGAARAMLLSVESNLRYLKPGNQFGSEIASGAAELRNQLRDGQ
jgi:formiminotetrahydrofolate cyclodeaminase